MDSTQLAKNKIHDELSKAIDLLNSDADPHYVIHEVRKCFKKIRSYLRLVKEHINFKRENRFFRDLGMEISYIRDLSSSIETLERLKEAAPAKTLDELNQGILELRQKESQSLIQDNIILRQIEIALHIKREQVENWQIEIDENTFSRNFNLTLEEVQVSATKAEQDGDSEDYHEWRKQVKHLRYQVEFLSGHHFPHNEEVNNSLHRLSDFIGWDHDLAILRELIHNKVELAENTEKNAFYKIMDNRQQELRRQALNLKEDELPGLIRMLK